MVKIIEDACLAICAQEFFSDRSCFVFTYAMNFQSIVDVSLSSKLDFFNISFCNEFEISKLKNGFSQVEPAERARLPRKTALGEESPRSRFPPPIHLSSSFSTHTLVRTGILLLLLTTSTRRDHEVFCRNYEYRICPSVGFVGIGFCSSTIGSPSYSADLVDDESIVCIRHGRCGYRRDRGATHVSLDAVG